MTHARTSRAAIKRAAVASPGQTVFIEIGGQMSEADIVHLKQQLGAVVEDAEIKVVLLADGVKVAKIEDAA